jgi:RNA polymerase sigma-70 factor (family 1)
MSEGSQSYDEVSLLAAVAGGDQQAFKRLYKHWEPLLSGYVYRLSNSLELAEEVVQDVFLKIWMARETLVNVRHFKNFLYTVSNNHFYTVVKKQMRERRRRLEWEKIASMEISGVDEENDWKISLIDEAIEQLPSRRREVYRLSRHAKLSYNEIAERLGISRASVASHLQLAIRDITTYISQRLGFLLILLFF